MNDDINLLYRRLTAVALADPLIKCTCIITTIAGIITIVLRVNQIPIIPPYILLFFACIIISSVITIIVKRKSLPTRNQVISMLDNTGHCGGLLMAQGISGSEF